MVYDNKDEVLIEVETDGEHASGVSMSAYLGYRTSSTLHLYLRSSPRGPLQGSCRSPSGRHADATSASRIRSIKP